MIRNRHRSVTQAQTRRDGHALLLRSFLLLHSSPYPSLISSPVRRLCLEAALAYFPLTSSVSCRLLLMCIATDPDAFARIAMRVRSATRQTAFSISVLFAQAQPYVAYFHWFRSDMSLFLTVARLVVPAVAGAVMASLGFILVSTALSLLWSKRVSDLVTVSRG